MPSGKLHNFTSRLILNVSSSRVDKWMDRPWRKYGRKHRKYRHGRRSAIKIARKLKGRRGIIFLQARLHAFLDNNRRFQRLMKRIYNWPKMMKICAKYPEDLWRKKNLKKIKKCKQKRFLINTIRLSKKFLSNEARKCQRSFPEGRHQIDKALRTVEDKIKRLLSD